MNIQPHYGHRKFVSQQQATLYESQPLIACTRSEAKPSIKRMIDRLMYEGPGVIRWSNNLPVLDNAIEFSTKIINKDCGTVIHQVGPCQASLHMIPFVSHNIDHGLFPVIEPIPTKYEGFMAEVLTDSFVRAIYEKAKNSKDSRLSKLNPALSDITMRFPINDSSGFGNLGFLIPSAIEKWVAFLDNNKDIYDAAVDHQITFYKNYKEKLPTYGNDFSYRVSWSPDAFRRLRKGTNEVLTTFKTVLKEEAEKYRDNPEKLAQLPKVDDIPDDYWNCHGQISDKQSWFSKLFKPSNDASIGSYKVLA